MKNATVTGNWALCAILVIVSACSGKPQDTSGPEPVYRDLITESQLSEVDAINAYTAVQQLRPRWLRSRGPTSMSQPMGTLPAVYADNMRLGDISALQAIPIAEIAEIRYISAADATTRWGTGVAGGVIEIIRKRRKTKG